ncbi:MAG TPA: ATPase, T2SS/T4P/T4SS family, partial [Candidatus Omnitrophota bacterium]|nr:ATPase, T2SS/T4P/T4SS family [Candidatus Omnitrophota bacterium]
MAKRVLIGEELVRKGIITPEQLKEALEEHKRTNTKIGEVLVKKGFATESDVARVLSDQLGFPFVELETFPIDQKITEMIPRNIAERFMVIAIRRDDDVIDVAVADPFDLAAVDEITRITGGAYRIRSFVATASSIRAAVNKFYGASAVMPRMTVGSFGTKSVRPAGAHKPTDKEEIVLQEEAEQAPVIKLVNSVIEEAVRNGASDIHLEPEKKVFHCRMRVDGILHDGASLPVEFQRAVISRIKIMANMNIAQS